jgi:hypothetical protein
VERPTLEYRGVWVASVSYAENSAVTHNGGVCIAKTANHGVEPPGPQWRLAVKKGRDGRDLDEATVPWRMGRHRLFDEEWVACTIEAVVEVGRAWRQSPILRDAGFSDAQELWRSIDRLEATIIGQHQREQIDLMRRAFVH